jgi:uncharacterized membrane protein YcaP (DUF421 family)
VDFYEGQHSLTIIEWLLRSIVSFVFLLLVAKLLGQRSISQLRILDFIIALMLGNIIAHPLSDEELGLKGAITTTLAIAILYVTATYLSLKIHVFKRFLDPPPITLIHKGQIQFPNLSKARISIDFLFSELRKEQVSDIQHVAHAAWEPGGIISIFLDTPHQPLTPSDMLIKTQPFSLTRPIIIDGVVDQSLLQQLNKDQPWLERKISPTYKHVQDIILATVDDHENIRVYTNPNTK